MQTKASPLIWLRPDRSIRAILVRGREKREERESFPCSLYSAVYSMGYAPVLASVSSSPANFIMKFVYLDYANWRTRNHKASKAQHIQCWIHVSNQIGTGLCSLDLPLASYQSPRLIPFFISQSYLVGVLVVCFLKMNLFFVQVRINAWRIINIW